MKSTESTPNRPRPIIGSLRRIAIWLVVLGMWEGAYRLIGWKDYVFPAPSHVLQSFVDMLTPSRVSGDRPLVEGVLVSVVRLTVGFAISVAVGVVLGALTWRFKELDLLLGPLFLGLQTLPSVCWVPLAILTLGLNEQGILFVMLMGSVFAVAISFRDGLRTIPPVYQRAGRMLGAGGWRLYRYVLLPASLPAMAGSLRQGFSFAWRSLLGAEMLFSVKYHGLGLLLMIGRETADVAQVIAVMIVMVVLGMLADRWIFAKLQARVQARFGLA
jgi:NitT/TauT family transport system permease protein